MSGQTAPAATTGQGPSSWPAPGARRADLAVIGGVLIALTALTWGYTLYLAGRPMSPAGGGASMDAMGMAGASEMGAVTMGMTAALFLAMWAAMMAAMMFPTIIPVLTIFAHVNRTRRARSRVYVPTWTFLLGYVVIWAGTALPAYAIARAADALVARAGVAADAAPYVGGVVLIGAGVYQFSSLKELCLTACRSPLGFVMSSWRDGYGGALRMGIAHGWYCLGCCWVLFLIFFAVGVMNLAWMAALAVLVFVEKVTPFGRAAGRLAAAGLVVAGVGLLVNPALVPGT